LVEHLYRPTPTSYAGRRVVLFLPSANLLVYGMLFSYALGNAAQFSAYMSGVYSDASALINKATALF
jgi:hypothetical protein